MRDTTVGRNAVKGVDNAMPCHRTGYDRYKIRTPATQILYNEKREKGKDKEGHKIKKSSRRQPEPTHEALS